MTKPKTLKEKDHKKHNYYWMNKNKYYCDECSEIFIMENKQVDEHHTAEVLMFGFVLIAIIVFLFFAVRWIWRVFT